MSAQSGRRPPTGYIDPDFPNPNGPYDVPIIIYGYTPSFALALLAAILFFLLLLVHTWQVWRYRSWYFVTFPVGLVFEVAGYAARSLSARRDPYHLIYFVLNYFFIVTAPVLLAAGIYAVLSALIRRLGGGRYSPVPPRAVLAIFITSDVLATVAQVAGAAMIGARESAREDPTTANHVLLGGLAYQVFAMGVFVILTVVFAARARKEVRASGLVTFVAAFAAATLLVYLRTCFRLAETAQGLGGYLSTHEVFFGTLEFAPVVLAVMLFAVWHPGRCVGSRLSTGKKEDEKAGQREITV